MDSLTGVMEAANNKYESNDADAKAPESEVDSVEIIRRIFQNIMLKNYNLMF